MSIYIKCTNPHCNEVIVAALIWEDSEIIEYRAICEGNRAGYFDYKGGCDHVQYFKIHKESGEVSPSNIEIIKPKIHEETRTERWIISVVEMGPDRFEVQSSRNDGMGLVSMRIVFDNHGDAFRQWCHTSDIAERQELSLAGGI